MKALLFILLLLLIVISPSLTAPTPKYITRAYTDRQRIIYTIFTADGAVINIECLWDPRLQRLVPGPHTTEMEIEQQTEPLVERVRLFHERVRRWTFNTNPPGSENIFVTARLSFTPETHNMNIYGEVPTGVNVINPETVQIWQYTSRYTWGLEYTTGTQLAVTFVFRAILPQNSLSLSVTDRNIIQTQGPGFFMQPIGRPDPTKRILPLQLDSGIWIHLLSGTMSEYKPGAIECMPAPEPHPHPDDTCRASSSSSCSRPRDPDDPDDPEAQREAKRQRTFEPGEHSGIEAKDRVEDKDKVGGVNQGHNRQHDDWTIYQPFGVDTSDTSPLWDLSGGSWLGLPAPRSRKDNNPINLIRICYEVFMTGSSVGTYDKYIHNELRR
jgi:hypothetical protein